MKVMILQIQNNENHDHSPYKYLRIMDISKYQLIMLCTGMATLIKGWPFQNDLKKDFLNNRI